MLLQYSMYMHVDYNDVVTSHAMENILYKQQCTTGFAVPRKYKVLFKNYIHCMFTSPHECGLCTHHRSSFNAPGRWVAECL